jgi:AraC-like DNA-binding protein
MQNAESLADFYTRNPDANPSGLSLTNASGQGHFNVFMRKNCLKGSSYKRRDFYKISLIIGTGRLMYADKWIEVDRPALLFSNPVVPYAWEPVSEEQDGYFCLFTESFITQPLQQSPIFRIGGRPLYFVDDKQQAEISTLYEKMIEEIGSDYPLKYDVLRNYTHLLIHCALKLQPVDDYRQHTNANTRITELFLELLERQFPVDAHEHPLQFRSAVDFANSLSVHVNHLNRAVKEVTGKTTTKHISDRVIEEARTLLLHSDWSLAEIAYSLGFEYPNYFNNFFKKQTQVTPLSVRKGSLPA